MGLLTHPMEYVRVGTVAEATQTLIGRGEDARVIAGGQSLVPLMKLQLIRPTVLVDISTISGLDEVRVAGDQLEIGALVSHARLERDPIVRRELPLLAKVAAVVADPQIRTLGTMGGVIAHADSAGDYCMLAILLDATIVTTERQIPASEFFRDAFTTALSHGELVVAVRFPRCNGPHAYVKDLRVPYNAGIPGVAVQRLNENWRIALTNLEAVPVRGTEIERRLADGAAFVAAVEGAWADAGLIPSEDIPLEYRRHVARVFTRRALESAIVA